MSNNRCPNCGAIGGGPAGCSNCGLGKDPNVGRHINTGMNSEVGQRARMQSGNTSSNGGCMVFLVGAGIGAILLYLL